MAQSNARLSRLRSLLILDVAQMPPSEGLPAADAIVLDAAIGHGRAGRTARAAAMATLMGRVRARAYRPALLVRMGASDWAAAEDYLDAVMAHQPDGIVLAGCPDGAALQRLGVKLSVREATHGIADGVTPIVADVGGSAAGLLSLATFKEASPRLAAVTWDAAALAAQCGAAAEAFADEGGSAAVVRTLMILTATSLGVPAYDTPSPLPLERLARDCATARRLGFRGKMTRDPAQVAVIDSVFASGEPARLARA